MLPDDDPAERAALAERATVDQAQAEAAALDAAGSGTAVHSELEEEDGYVVWDVSVRLDDGTAREILVDAGDASILGNRTRRRLSRRRRSTTTRAVHGRLPDDARGTAPVAGLELGAASKGLD